MKKNLRKNSTKWKIGKLQALGVLLLLTLPACDFDIPEKFKDEKDKTKAAEDIRLLGDKLHALVKGETTVHILFTQKERENALLVTEGLALSATGPKPSRKLPDRTS